MDMESKTVDTYDLDHEVKLQSKAYQAFRKEQEYWRIKSHNTWLKVGDKNTVYFHR